MTPTIICLHASPSNIELVDKALQTRNVKLIHMVDKELMQLIKNGASSEQLQLKIQMQFSEIVAQKPDFILVTCTNYIAILDEVSLMSDIPILKIDELLFAQMQNCVQPIKILFSNEHTIAGTMKRLHAYLGTDVEVEAIYIPDIFEAYINGDVLLHDQLLLNRLLELESYDCTVAVGQLSMAKVAQIYNRLTKQVVLNPILALQQHILFTQTSKANEL